MGKGEFPEANRDARERRIWPLGLGLVARRSGRAGQAPPLQQKQGGANHSESQE